MGMFGALWGIAGVSLLLGSAIFRLGDMAVEAFHHDFYWYHWFSLTAIVLFMAYAEGYKGFQQRFSPRVAARARYLRDFPNAILSFLAPLFCMGYFHAARRRIVVSISLTLGIIMLVLMVRLLPQPWRGIVDTGVVTGLLWGLATLLFYSFKAFASKDFKHSPEVPENQNIRAKK